MPGDGGEPTDPPLSLRDRIAAYEQASKSTTAATATTTATASRHPKSTQASKDTPNTAQDGQVKRVGADDQPSTSFPSPTTLVERERDEQASSAATSSPLTSAALKLGAGRPQFSSSNKRSADSNETDAIRPHEQALQVDTKSYIEATESPRKAASPSSVSKAASPPPPIPARPGSQTNSPTTSNPPRPAFETRRPSRSATMSSSSSARSDISNQSAPPRLPPRRSSTLSAGSAVASLNNVSVGGPTLPPRPARNTAASSSPVRPQAPLPASTAVTPVSPTSYTRYTPSSRRLNGAMSSDSKTSSLASSELSRTLSAASSNATPTTSGRSTPTNALSASSLSSSRPRPIDPRARKRYDKLFDQCRFKDPTRPQWIKDSGTDEVDGLIVRQVWLRSRLPSERLSQIWLACDASGKGKLHRNEFSEGMWMIDEELRRRRQGLRS
ncbi:hypothetical protein ACM66B_005176 [Microbotryomycetes sp. NB124-2]